MKGVDKFENWVSDPDDLIDQFKGQQNFTVKKAKETIDRLVKELEKANNKKNKNMNTNELTKYKPYSVGRFKGEYADIIFEQEGLMTVPKGSAQTIVDLLNDAFKNGVRMTLKNGVNQNGITTPDQPMIKSKPMPQEEPHPINAYTRKR